MCQLLFYGQFGRAVLAASLSASSQFGNSWWSYCGCSIRHVEGLCRSTAGRGIKDVARRDTAMGAARYHRNHRRRLVRRGVGPVSALLFVAGFAGVGGLTMAVLAVVVLAQGVLFGGGAVV